MFSLNNEGRTIVLTGHYGSGKTEVALNLAMRIKRTTSNVAIIDLDIANPYFRSRELPEMLRFEGIDLISNAYGYDITADLPAISSEVKSYIGSDSYCSIVDAGGNDSGARILNQYKAQLSRNNTSFYIVVNVYRPETDNAEKIIEMMRSIEIETGQKINGIVNNSNLLKCTSFEHIMDSVQIINEVILQTGVPVVMNCCEDKFAEDIADSAMPIVLPMELQMRPAWLDI